MYGDMYICSLLLVLSQSGRAENVTRECENMPGICRLRTVESAHLLKNVFFQCYDLAAGSRVYMTNLIPAVYTLTSLVAL